MTSRPGDASFVRAGSSGDEIVASVPRSPARAGPDPPFASAARIAPHKIRAILEYVDEETRSAFKRFRHRLDGGLVDLLLERRSEIGHPDPH